MAQFKIVTDSSSDVLKLDTTPFASAPLKIITANKEYVDDEHLNVEEMVNDLQGYKGRSSTSCPNAEDWLQTFGDADFVFCVTITGTLSGSYNSALSAKTIYEETYPDRKVFVLDSKSTGPEIALILEKLEELISENKDYDTICEEITNYCQSTRLLFMLESLKNLANNGRVNSLVAKMAGILGIRLVGKASIKGDLEPLNKCRGERKALEATVENMQKEGFGGGKVIIAHCFNISIANELKEMIVSQFPSSVIKIYSCRGLCSFYAEKGGFLIGFEAE